MAGRIRKNVCLFQRKGKKRRTGEIDRRKKPYLITEQGTDMESQGRRAIDNKKYLLSAERVYDQSNPFYELFQARTDRRQPKREKQKKKRK